jgi:hypothetical protein
MSSVPTAVPSGRYLPNKVAKAVAIYLVASAVVIVVLDILAPLACGDREWAAVRRRVDAETVRNAQVVAASFPAPLAAMSVALASAEPWVRAVAMLVAAAVLAPVAWLVTAGVLIASTAYANHQGAAEAGETAKPIKRD